MSTETAPAAAPAATEPSLLSTEVEDELRANVRALLAARCDWKSVLDRTESDAQVDAGLWQALVGELGVTALPVPEELGGAGASWREAAVVIEELGRAVAPVPFLGSAVLSTAALLALAEAAPRRRRSSARWPGASVRRPSPSPSPPPPAPPSRPR